MSTLVSGDFVNGFGMIEMTKIKSEKRWSGN